MTKENLEAIQGIVKNITFHNEENGYTVAKIIPEKSRKIIAVTGYVKRLSKGETVVLRGYWVNDPKWGRQFKFHSYELVIPSSLEGIKRFLASKYIKGIGPKYAERIVNTFGKDTIRVLDETPERLIKVPGLPSKKVESIIKGWAIHRKIRDVMIFLHAHDISEAYASRIYEKYEADTIDKLRSNPYRLISDFRGIGFIKADRIAKKLGIAENSPERVHAGILYCLDELFDKGHVFVPMTTLIESAAEMLNLDSAFVLDNIDYLKKNREIIIDDDRVYRKNLFASEFELAQRLKLIAAASRSLPVPPLGKLKEMIREIEHKRKITFAPMQFNAVLNAVVSNFMVITGGPGTGKTTTVVGIIEIFQQLKLSVLLCAPTGRAAKRLSEATGMEAKTIHRLLEYNPKRGTFTKNEGNPLSAHVVIMDEVSMVDTVIMTEFLRAVSPYTTLILVGDVDQLPSIGPGNVLCDIISCKLFPTVRLTEIFRQAASSKIVTSAHRINAGKIPYADNDRSGNFFFIKMNDPANIVAAIVDMVARRLPERYGFDPLNDIQVLSPMHKSLTGVENLNMLLQERLNPFRTSSPEIRKGGWALREGDKVMQIRNNYDKMVFNGDIGQIKRIIPAKSMVVVKFDAMVEYGDGELDDLIPAYAVSVHKSQGSEFRCVVMPVTTQHYIMLKRNLIYTAVTRARDLVVLIGDFKALAIAVGNDQVKERFTSLDMRLRGE